jgi:hypothetical protein
MRALKMLTGRSKSEIEERSNAVRAALRSKNTDALRKRLFERQSGICAFCRKPLESSDSALSAVGHGASVYDWAELDIGLDEVILHANDETNLVVLHPGCNTTQNAIQMQEFLEKVDLPKPALRTSPKVLKPEDLSTSRKEEVMSLRLNALYVAALERMAALDPKVTVSDHVRRAVKEYLARHGDLVE